MILTGMTYTSPGYCNTNTITSGCTYGNHGTLNNISTSSFGSSNIIYSGKSNQTTISTANGNLSWESTININVLKDMIDLLFSLNGIDCDYERFSEFTESDKKQFLREIKLDKLLN